MISTQIHASMVNALIILVTIFACAIVTSPARTALKKVIIFRHSNNGLTSVNTVLGPPNVEEGPSNITNAHLLFSFNLTCSSENNPIYQWYKDDELVFNTTESVLVVEEAQPSDRGKYVCVAVNGEGTAKSSPGLVTILG